MCGVPFDGRFVLTARDYLPDFLERFHKISLGFLGMFLGFLTILICSDMLTFNAGRRSIHVRALLAQREFRRRLDGGKFPNSISTKFTRR